MSKFAWVTLTTNDTYSLGALVLAHSLRRAGTQHQLAVLVTSGVSESMRSKLRDVYNVVQEVNVMDSQDSANLALLARPELGITFTKLHCWRLLQFEKCVFLDSDTLVLQNCDELFEREEFSAAPDVSWPDCFNSGVFVYKPSQETFDKIVDYGLKNGSFDGGDQGLLNQYFSDWATADLKKRLPFLYNVTAYASYCYLPAFKQFRDKIKILHFAGKMKPWLIHYNSQSKTPSIPSDYTHAADLIQLWWNIFFDHVHQILNDNMAFQLQQQHCEQKEYEAPPQATDLHFKLQFDCYQQLNSDNKIEFHDPWEDYYRKQERDAELQQSLGVRNANGIETCPLACDEENKVRDMKQQQHNVASREENCIRDLVQESECSLDLECENVENPITVSSCDCDVNTALSSDDIKHDNIKRAEEMTEKVRDIDNSQLLEDNTAESLTNRHTSIESNCSRVQYEVSNTGPSQNVNNNSVCEDVETNVKEAGLAGALSHLRLGEPRNPEQDAYEQLMRRQCWESGQVDYSGRDSFDNIWMKITQTLETKPDNNGKTDGFANNNHSVSLVQIPEAIKPQIRMKTTHVANVETTKAQQISHKSSSTKQKLSRKFLTSADIEDGKIEYDAKTGASTQYRVIEGGYEVVTTTPQPNGTVKTSTRTFWDPKPVSEEDLKKEQANKKIIQSRMNKEIRIDERTTMLTRAIEGGYEEVYTTINEDGTKSTKTKTFFDSVPEGTPFPGQAQQPKQPGSGNKKVITRKTSVESNDSTDSRRVVQKVNKNQQVQNFEETSNVKQQSTYEETRHLSQNIEITENNRTVRKNSLQTETSLRQLTSSNVTDGKATNKTKKTKKPKSSVPPPPADFVQNETTTVTTKRVPGGHEYTYTTELESGRTISTSKTVYEEEETELTEEEIKQYKKTLKDAEKHKNVTSTKKLKSEYGTKKIVPSENPGEVTTVETIQIDGATEYHYTTVTAEGIVKKTTKTVYDPVRTSDPDEGDEEEIVEEYEEEIIEPGEKNVRTIETIRTLPKKFEEEVTITHEKKEKKTKRSMIVSH